MDRVEIAKIFKIRSDESFEAACVCLEKGLKRVCVVNSWYSVMQLITGATYVVLIQKKPPSDQLNWSHKIQANLFEEIASRKTGVPREFFSKYSREISNLYEKRSVAHYRADRDAGITQEYAESSIAAATLIRAKVIELVGEWP